MTVFNDTFDTATPAGSDDPAEADDRMREIKAAVQERENVDHYWPLTGTEVSDADAGEHRKVLFRAPISTPDSIAENHGQLYLKDVNGKAELFFIDEDENEIQLTNVGKLVIANNTYLISRDQVGTGTVNLIKATTGDIPEILTGAVLSASTAPVVDAGIANKLYVDNRRAHIKISDLKSNGTSGGDFTLGAWRTRDLTTEDSDTGNNASLSSNQITLAVGTYECRISAPAFRVNAHQTRLRNVTAGTDIIIGTCEYADSDNIGGNRSFISDRFTIAASQALEVQHRAEVTKTVDGFGVKSSLGIGEVYTIAEFWKI